MRFCLPIMGQSQKFKQQWEWRRRDTSPSDSSSNEPESGSSEEPILKKHKLISDWMSPKADEAGSFTRCQPKAINGSTMGSHHRAEKTNRVRKKGDDPVYDKIKEDNKKKSYSCVDEPVTLDDTRIFMESILEELRVARENLLIRLREEMHKVLSDDSAPGPKLSEGNCEQQICGGQHQNSFESNAQNQVGGTLVGSTKRKRIVNSSKHSGFPADQSDYWKTFGSMNEFETDREGRQEPSAKGSSSLFSPGGFDSTSVTPAAVIPGACDDNLRLHSPPCNYSQAMMVENRMAFDRGNHMFDPSMHHENLLGSQEEDFENVAYTGSKDQNKLTLPSRFGTGFPVPLFHGFDGAFKAQTQVSKLKQSQNQNKKLVLSMDEVGMRHPVGGSHGFPDVYVSSDLYTHLNSKAIGDAWTLGNSMP